MKYAYLVGCEEEIVAGKENAKPAQVIIGGPIEDLLTAFEKPDFLQRVRELVMEAVNKKESNGTE